MTIPETLHRILIPDPADPLKAFVQIASLLGALFAIGIVLITKTLPWLRAKRDSRSVEKRLGAQLYTAENIARSLRYYVTPFCQDIDPAGGEEPRLVYGVKQKLFAALDDALTNPTEYRYVILLADSGMGKTTALLNYYVRHIRRRRKFNLTVIPLGIPDADDRIGSIENKGDTILFLDALDEDTLAIVDHVERLRILLRATQEFRRVVISCRTQFFSRDEEIPKGTGILKVGSRAAGEPPEYFFHKIYLTPFSDKQVKSYIRRRYPFWLRGKRRLAQDIVDKIPHLAVRPMLLAHIDDLVQSHRRITFPFQLYEEMVEAWLTREEGFVRDRDDLHRFSERLAVDLYVNRATRGAERIPKAELKTLATEWNIPLDDWKLSGRSLLNRDAEGNYKFAHRSVMEYLFVKRFFDCDPRCIEVDWTDQMLAFLQDTVADDDLNGSTLTSRQACAILTFLSRAATERSTHERWRWVSTRILKLASRALGFGRGERAILLNSHEREFPSVKIPARELTSDDYMRINFDGEYPEDYFERTIPPRILRTYYAIDLHLQVGDRSSPILIIETKNFVERAELINIASRNKPASECGMGMDIVVAINDKFEITESRLWQLLPISLPTQALLLVVTGPEYDPNAGNLETVAQDLAMLIPRLVRPLND